MKELAGYTLFALATSLSASCMAAQVSAQGGARGLGTLAQSFSQTGSTTAAGSATSGANSSDASIRLDTGVLRSTSTTASGVASIYSSAGSAVQIDDRLTFMGSATAVRLDWAVDGTITFNASRGSASQTFAQISFDVEAPTYTRYQYVFASPGACQFAPSATRCDEGVSFSASGSLFLPTQSGSAKLTIYFGTNATSGDSASFGNTARLYLATPPGLSVSSESGAFLINASPVSEPSTLAFFCMGLFAVYLKRRSLGAA